MRPDNMQSESLERREKCKRPFVLLRIKCEPFNVDTFLKVLALGWFVESHVQSVPS